MSDVCEELKKMIGTKIFVDIIGKDFAPKGILKEVHDDYIVVGENHILISSITSFKKANDDGGGWR
jgi:hypothetical protein